MKAKVLIQGIDRITMQALREDLGKGDLTSESLLPKNQEAVGTITAKENGVFAGGPVAKTIFSSIDPKLKLTRIFAEGKPFSKGQPLLTVRGNARSLLAAERTVLNFLQHLCGIATQTRTMVQRVKNTRAKIYATRKTLPGLRGLQKYAVTIGGGHAHRMGLYDAVLIKDNHLAMNEESPARCMQLLRKKLRNRAPVMAEAESVEQAKQWIEQGVRIILLDNMKPHRLKRTVTALRRYAAQRRRRVEFEASGGIGPHNVRQFARSGVDRISIGALTHSVKAIDLSMEIIPRNGS